MKIEAEDMVFGDLKYGDPFWFNNILFMKCNQKGTAANLLNGDLHTLDNKDKIHTSHVIVVEGE